MELNNSSLLFSRLKQGFTLIEMLIVIGIVGIVSTLSIASYNTFSETSRLKSEVQKFVVALSLAQKRAVAGEDVSSYCANNFSFNSFVVTSSTSTGYSVQGQCVNDLPPYDITDYGTPIDYRIDSVNRNVSILNTVTTPLTITFNKLTGLPDGSYTVLFKNTLANECIQVDIDANGTISSSKVACP